MKERVKLGMSALAFAAALACGHAAWADEAPPAGDRSAIIFSIRPRDRQNRRKASSKTACWSRLVTSTEWSTQ